MVELTYVGFDQKSFDTGKDDVPVTTDINESRTLEVTPDRTAELADVLQNTVTPKRANKISAVCMDIWQTYEASTTTSPANAAIVLDRFHVATYPNEDSVKFRNVNHRTITQVVKDHLSGIRQNSLLAPENLTYETKSNIIPLRKSPPDTGHARSFKAPLLLLWLATHMVGGRPFFDSCYTWSRNLLAPINKRARILTIRFGQILICFSEPIGKRMSARFNGRVPTIESAPYRSRIFKHFPFLISSIQGSPPKNTNTRRYYKDPIKVRAPPTQQRSNTHMTTS